MNRHIVHTLIALSLVAAGCSANVINSESSEVSQAPAPVDSNQVADSGVVAIGAPAAMSAITPSCDRPDAADVNRFDSFFVRHTSAIDTTVQAFKEADLGAPTSSGIRLLGDHPFADPEFRTHRDVERTALGGQVVVGAPPDLVNIATAEAEYVEGLDDDVRLLLAVRPNGALAVVAEQGMDTAFASCIGRPTEALAAFREANPELDSGSGIDLLIQLFDPLSAASDALRRQFEAPSEIAWSDRDPATRVIDPDETPQEVFESLVAVTFTVDLGPGWLAIPDVTICSRISSIGWNECSRPSNAVDRSLLLRASANREEDLELWLLDQVADVSQPIAYLGRVDISDALQAENGGTRIILKDVADLSDVLAQEGSLVEAVIRD